MRQKKAGKGMIILLIIGILCILYGIFVLCAQTGVWFYVIWIVIGAVFLLLGWMVHMELIAAMRRELALLKARLRELEQG